MESLTILYKGSIDLDKPFQKSKNYDTDQILIQVFAGGCDRSQLEELQAALVSRFPGVPIVGSTTEGEIHGRDISVAQIVLSFSFFKDTKIQTLHNDEGDVPDPAKLAKAIKATGARAAIMFRSGTDSGQLQRSHDYISVIGIENPGLVLAGGQAGVGEEYVDTFVFTESFLSSRGTVVATLTGPSLNAESLRVDGWEQIGRAMEVTKAVGNRIYEIDYRNIFNIYKHYLGVDVELNKLQNPTLEFPLTCIRDGILMKNIPVKSHGDGSIEFLFPFKEGEKIKFSFCDISRLYEDLRQMHERVAEKNPQSIFIYACSGRKMILGNKIAAETKAFSDLGDCSGFFTSTEFYSGGNQRCRALIQNMTMLVLSEGPQDRSAQINSEALSLKLTEQEKQSLKTLRIMSNLISATSRELEMSNRALSEMAVMDGMTGLLNRRSFNVMIKRELGRHSRSLAPMSFLLIDIDYFKQFNDHYGHVAGDECLERIGKIIRTTMQRSTDLAFRYGGEELCCLLPSTDANGARLMAERLQANLREAAIPHAGSAISDRVSVSIGYMTYLFSGETRPNEDIVIGACDKMLYKAKDSGRDRIVGGEMTI